MGFLSLTFAASLKKQKHSVFLVSILLPPLSLWLGGFIGATTAAAVARAPAMHVALISFGIAALLFLEPPNRPGLPQAVANRRRAQSFELAKLKS